MCFYCLYLCEDTIAFGDNVNRFFWVEFICYIDCIYIWRKVVCFVLLCSYEIHWNGMLQIMILVSLESSQWGGAWAWFHDVWTCSAKVLEYWMIFSLKIKWNCSWKFQRNWNVPLVLLERSCWAGFNGISLVRFGLKMQEILIFKWFLLLKVQINSQKPGFGRKNRSWTW
jgi:hypothetical protein